MKLDNRQDVYSFINCIPLDIAFYKENYAEIAGDNLIELLVSKGFKWGDHLENYHIEEREFWDCFKDAEN